VIDFLLLWLSIISLMLLLLVLFLLFSNSSSWLLFVHHEVKQIFLGNDELSIDEHMLESCEDSGKLT